MGIGMLSIFGEVNVAYIANVTKTPTHSANTKCSFSDSKAQLEEQCIMLARCNLIRERIFHFQRRTKCHSTCTTPLKLRKLGKKKELLSEVVILSYQKKSRFLPPLECQSCFVF
jgi:hypothetical protein